MNLTLFTGINYYNRQVISPRRVGDFERDYGLTEVTTIEDIAFIPNDGINTTQIVNYSIDLETYFDGRSSPTYAVLYDDDDPEIIYSRWWVTESVLVRKGQARLSLLRDVIADFSDIILNSPAYVRRGYIPSTQDPLIFSPENFSCNQIKQSELMLYDHTKMPWIVGYTSSKIEFPEGDNVITIPLEDVVVNYQTGKAGYAYNQYNTQPFYVYKGTTQYRINLFGTNDPGFERAGCFAWNQNGEPAAALNESVSYASPYVLKRDNDLTDGYNVRRNMGTILQGSKNMIDDLTRGLSQYDWTAFTTGYDNRVKTAADYALLAQEDGKILKDNDKYYRIQVIKTQRVTSITAPISANTPLSSTIQAVVDGFTVDFSRYEQDEPRFEIESYVESYFIQYQEINIESCTLTIPADRVHLSDAPYDMFCIPVGNIFIGGKPTLPNFAWKLAANIIKALQPGSSSNLYDIQLLPYCPIEQTRFMKVLGDTWLKFDTWTDHTRAVSKLEDGNGNLYSAMIWCDKSSFSTQLTDEEYQITVPENPIDFKIDNQCDMYRICSPNYSGQFEFSATKNGGVLGWNIDCTYKPYQPYIQVAPIFARLYGQDFNDARGLICSGDFSISQVSDAWTTYQIQNKNYENIFKAQIENMDSVREIQRKQEIAGMTGGILTGIGTGAMAGGLGFGAPGAIVGGLTGGLASAIGGALDLKYSKELYEINKSFTEEMYQLGIENIQALPYSITKVGAQTVVFKDVPFVEKYSATEKEKEILRNKMIYNGMTVEAVGRIIDYLGDEVKFIQATPIRLQPYTYYDTIYEFDEDSHVADFIAAELQKGVYFGL